MISPSLLRFLRFSDSCHSVRGSAFSYRKPEHCTAVLDPHTICDVDTPLSKDASTPSLILDVCVPKRSTATDHQDFHHCDTPFHERTQLSSLHSLGDIQC